MRNLNVIQTSKEEIEEKWNLKLPNTFSNKEVYIRCNSKGKVNWMVAPIYRKEELEARGDYTIIIVINIDEVIKSEQ